MGDFRASVKIQFSMGGIEDEVDFWINWTPDWHEWNGLDRRIGEWIVERAEKGSENIRDAIMEGTEAERKRQEEKREREEFERLKAKYG